MKRNRFFLPAAILVLSILATATAAAKAETIIDFSGVHRLIPDRPGQTVAVYVSGTAQVAGMNFRARIGDGGPEMVEFDLPPGVDGPAFSNVDVKTATIFSNVPTHQSGWILIPQVADYNISIDSGSVAADGLLATLTIDTSGFFAGTWDLVLTDILPGYYEQPINTELLYNHVPINVTIRNGSIKIARYGDCNRDGVVNLSDLAVLAANWLRDGVGWDEGDFNGDGTVDGADATMLAVNWQCTDSPAAQAVPEPSAIFFICVGLFFLSWRYIRQSS